jgi:hypothetical protein
MTVRPRAHRWAPIATIALLPGVSVTRLPQPSAAPTLASMPKYKGIFEPMNHPEDISFNDVFSLTTRSAGSPAGAQAA